MKKIMAIIVLATAIATAGDLELCRLYIYETMRDDKKVRGLHSQGDIDGARSFASKFTRDAASVKKYCSGINRGKEEREDFFREIEKTRKTYRRSGLL